VPERFCWAVPPGLSADEAACVPVAYGTADDALFEFGRLKRGETVLVQAGAGGVGIAAVQLAKRAGARVFATASSDLKLERLTELGLDHGINYRTTGFADEVRRLTGGHGADIILDPVGGQTLRDSLRCLAYRGRCISIGDAGRQHGTPTDISTLRPNNQTLAGYFPGAELVSGPRARTMISRLLGEVAAGDLRVVIDRTFPLAEAAAAHAYIESRQAFGRVLLKPLPRAAPVTGRRRGPRSARCRAASPAASGPTIADDDRCGDGGGREPERHGGQPVPPPAARTMIAAAAVQMAGRGSGPCAVP
jgi:NADPH2:quinone reductase